MFSLNKFSWVYKASESKWQRADGSWWTNHGGQVVPYSAATHGERPAQPNPAEEYEPSPQEREEAHQKAEIDARKKAQARDWRKRPKPGISDDRYGS
jgi:hypothetical protein